MDINDFTYEDALCMTEVCVPVIDWKKEGLTVVRDGHLDCGTRIHVVAEQEFKFPKIIANAIVISEDLNLIGK